MHNRPPPKRCDWIDMLKKRTQSQPSAANIFQFDHNSCSSWGCDNMRYSYKITRVLGFIRNECEWKLLSMCNMCNGLATSPDCRKTSSSSPGLQMRSSGIENAWTIYLFNHFFLHLVNVFGFEYVCGLMVCGCAIMKVYSCFKMYFIEFIFNGSCPLKQASHQQLD